MDELILQVFQAELLAGSSDVSLLVPVSLYYSVNGGDEDVASDVELSLVVEKGVLEVSLDDESTISYAFLVGQVFYLVQIVQDGNAVASI